MMKTLLAPGALLAWVASSHAAITPVNLGFESSAPPFPAGWTTAGTVVPIAEILSNTAAGPIRTGWHSGANSNPTNTTQGNPFGTLRFESDTGNTLLVDNLALPDFPTDPGTQLVLNPGFEILPFPTSWTNNGTVTFAGLNTSSPGPDGHSPLIDFLTGGTHQNFDSNPIEITSETGNVILRDLFPSDDINSSLEFSTNLISWNNHGATVNPAPDQSGVPASFTHHRITPPAKTTRFFVRLKASFTHSF